MKVVGVCPQVPNGCDLWRVAEPIDYLHNRGFDAQISLQGDPRHPIVVGGERPDVLVVSRWGIAPGFGEKIVMEALQDQARAIIWDLDDDLWHLEADNPWKAKNPPLAWLETMARRADLITTTTATLAAVIQKHIPEVPVRVVPNLIRLGRFVPREVIEGPLTLCLQGGYHDRDWSTLKEILVSVLSDHPDVTLRVIGDPQSWLADVPSEQLEYAPFQPYLKWPKMLNGIQIGLAPLRPSVFNRGKSPIKWFEYSTVGAATIASPTVYENYIGHGFSGLLADTPREWDEAIRFLINDGEYRERIARDAGRVVSEQHSLESRAEAIYPPLWKEAYRRWHKRHYTPKRKPSGETLSRRAARALSSLIPGATPAIPGSPTPGPVD